MRTTQLERLPLDNLSARLEQLPLDELWALHELVSELLWDRMQREATLLNSRLRALGRATLVIRDRRPYPKVNPKYRNPNNPAETWAGRGRKPRWIVDHLTAGRSIDELMIEKLDTSARTPVAALVGG